MIQASALLHDIAKGRKNHARVGGVWLDEMGFGRITSIVAGHMDPQPEAG